MSRYTEHVQLKFLTRDADAAVAKDLVDHAVRKGKELVEAAINNDAHAISVILSSYKKVVPMFQERLLNSDGMFAQSNTEERGIPFNIGIGQFLWAASSSDLAAHRNRLRVRVSGEG